MPDQSIPAPHPSFRGTAQKNPGNLDEMAAKWAIPGLLVEPVSTVSLSSCRLIDRETGKAYSIDELRSAGFFPTINDDGGVDVDGIIISDSSTVALADGVIGWNAALSAFIKHDGTTIGGDLIIPEDPLRIRGAAVFTTGLASDSVRVLDAFGISADQAIGGATFPLSGKICVAFVGTKPVTASIGVIPELSAGSGGGILTGFDLGGANVTLYDINVLGALQTFDNEDGTFALQEGALTSVQTRLTTATTSFSKVNATATSLEFGTLEVAQDWVLELHLAGQAALTQVFVSWDLKLEASN